MTALRYQLYAQQIRPVWEQDRPRVVNMTTQLARLAAAAVLGTDVGSVRPLAAGRSCEAYVVERTRGGSQYVVRVPVAGTDRSIRFHSEATLGTMLAARGHPVADWRVVDIDGMACTVGPLLTGTPIQYGVWTTAFTAQLGDLLTDLHTLPATGFGPLVDISGQLRGECTSVLPGVCRRWNRASCWPFDGTELADHVICRPMPDVAPEVMSLQGLLLEAAQTPPFGVVHSDLHREHLLTGSHGELTGVLDFGDGFVGSLGWDFALLRWYYGADVTRAVARRHPHGQAAEQAGRLLTLAVGIYKLAKTLADPQIPGRLRRSLREHGLNYKF